MAAAPSPEELQEAVLDLHQYLSDQKPPLMVADSIELLLRYPPEFLAAQINGWVASQQLTAPVSDFLYHGAKKVSVLGDLDLLPKDVLVDRLRESFPALLTFCPEADREMLKENLDRLGLAAPQAAASAAVLHTQAGPAAPPREEKPSVVSDLMDRGMRRLSLILDRLKPLASPSAPTEQKQEVASQFVTTAAMHAQTTAELEENLAPLRQVGVEVATEQLFRTLAGSLAGWALPTVEGHAAPVVSKDQIEAVRRIVSLPEDPAEVARRFREMVHAAIEQFNEGQIGRAVALFDLAEQLAAEKKVQPKFVEALRASGHEYLDAARLQSAAARSDYRAQMKRILAFFTPTQPQALLLQLDGEPRRDRRHQILALLEVHGEPARAAAWDLLKASVDGAQTDPFFQMNLVYLLRVIRRPDTASVEEEVDVVMRTSARNNPPPLVKQVIAYLGGTRHDKAERALITYLKVFESMMLAPDGAAYAPPDVEMLLDRTCAALARYGTPRAWRVLVDHGLKAEARLGSPELRLAEAGRVNLSADRELVARLIATIRAELPKTGMAALMSRKGDGKAIALIQALAGTPLPGVYELLQEIAGKYGDRDLGKTAASTLEALATVGRPPAPPSTLSGDLEMFGLPNLLQTLVQSQLTGVLSILDGEGKPQAGVLVEQGKFRGGHCGPVRGEAAVYQLLERPFKGTFAFVSRDVAGQENLVEPQDLFGLLMEGVRRYDEFHRAAGVVPDGAVLTKTDKKPAMVEGEDRPFAARAFALLASGRPVSQCETELATDPYRLRRLAAQWVEDGALTTRP